MTSSSEHAVRLGRTGVSLSPIGLGTWGFGGPVVVDGRAEGWGDLDEAKARETLLTAHEGGIVHWDTADAYGRGRAERMLGAVWRDVPRETIFLTSKVGYVPQLEGHVYEARHLRLQVEASLRRLRTDHLDACYLHHCDFGPDDWWLEEAAAMMRSLVEEGKVRYVGLSDWDVNAVARCATRFDPDLIQVPRNVVEDNYCGSLLERLAEERDFGVVFFSPLKHGLLAGRWRRAPRFVEGDVRGRVDEFRDEALLERIADLADEMAQLLPRHPHPLLAAAIAPLLETPRNVVLIGLRRPAHARAAVTLGRPIDPRLAATLRARFVAAASIDLVE